MSIKSRGNLLRGVLFGLVLISQTATTEGRIFQDEEHNRPGEDLFKKSLETQSDR